jgi:hypothetical protein
MPQVAAHHEIQTIKRSQAHSATARVAYICRTTVRDERTGETHRYQDDGDLGAVHVVGFDGDPEAFANALEAAEKRKDAQVGRSSILALPNELSDTAAARVVLAYQRQLRERYGCASVSALHRKDGNSHAHIVEATRDADGKKINSLSNKRTAAAEVEHRRQAWAACVNAELERTAPTVQRVDPRSLKRRAADGDREAAQRVSVPHLGPAQHAALKAKKKAPEAPQAPSWVRQRIAEARELAQAFTELRAAQKAFERLERIKAAGKRLAESRKPKPRQRHRGYEI